MKKRLLSLLIALTVIAMSLTGCGGGEEKTTESTTTSEDSVSPTTESTSSSEPEKTTEGGSDEPDENPVNARAHKAYEDFLYSEVSVYNLCEDTDSSGNVYGPLVAGDYYYGELRRAIAQFEKCDMSVSYSILDMNDDGVDELVLRMEASKEGCYNWTGIIYYDEDDILFLTHAFEDGGRIYSNVYTSGLIETGGAMGAGSSIKIFETLDEESDPALLFMEITYNGIFAEDIIYQLDTGVIELENKLSEIDGDCTLSITLYSTYSEDKVAVNSWSEDPAVKEREEAFISEIEGFGVEVISAEEMKKLTHISEKQLTPIKWTLFEEAIPGSDWQEGEESDIGIYIDFATEDMLKNFDNYQEYTVEYEGIDEDAMIDVILACDGTINDFTIYKIIGNKEGEDGMSIFEGSGLDSIETLSFDNPLVLHMPMIGSLPTVAVGFFKNGKFYTYGIVESGMDGSLQLVEIEIYNLK